MNVREVLGKTAPWLRSRGAPSPRLDAEVLLAFVLGTDRLRLYADLDRPLDDGELDTYRELVRRRGAGEPVAYLTGRKEFYGLEMKVTRDVLIPRPETEMIVDRARELAPRAILDLCTGSGCVAIACAVRLPEAEIVATDLSAAALAVARENAGRHGVSARIRFLEGDLFSALPERRTFDLIACNPPYVPEGEAVDVVAFEPKMAVWSGPGGLDLIDRILREAPRWLAPAGTMLMEMGEEQEPAVLERAGGFAKATVLRDASGAPRLFQGSVD